MSGHITSNTMARFPGPSGPPKSEATSTLTWAMHKYRVCVKCHAFIRGLPSELLHNLKS